MCRSTSALSLIVWIEFLRNCWMPLTVGLALKRVGRQRNEWVLKSTWKNLCGPLDFSNRILHCRIHEKFVSQVNQRPTIEEGLTFHVREDLLSVVWTYETDKCRWKLIQDERLKIVLRVLVLGTIQDMTDLKTSRKEVEPINILLEHNSKLLSPTWLVTNKPPTSFTVSFLTPLKNNESRGRYGQLNRMCLWRTTGLLLSL